VEINFVFVLFAFSFRVLFVVLIACWRFCFLFAVRFLECCVFCVLFSMGFKKHSWFCSLTGFSVKFGDSWTLVEWCFGVGWNYCFFFFWVSSFIFDRTSL